MPSTVSDDAAQPKAGLSHPETSKQKACDDLGVAIDTGKLGIIVAKYETLIQQYYEDVQDEAKQSFASARMVAQLGFLILFGTLMYALFFDAQTRFGRVAAPTAGVSLTVEKLGVISGALIEFIAGIQFWLYARAARQFGAFHVCLERTNRYLLAYKISEEIKINREETLHQLVCIMANASRIGSVEDDSMTVQRSTPGAHLAAVSAEVKQP